MARLNLTLDSDTYSALKRHAQRISRPAAGLARDLVREGLQQRQAAEQQRKLARDYAAGRTDTRDLLEELETAQLELLDGDEA